MLLFCSPVSFAEYAQHVRNATIAASILNAILSLIQAYFSNSYAGQMDKEEFKSHVQDLQDTIGKSNDAKISLLLPATSIDHQVTPKNLHMFIKIATTALTAVASILTTALQYETVPEKQKLYQVVAGVLTSLATALGTFSALNSTTAGTLYSKTVALKSRTKDKQNKKP